MINKPLITFAVLGYKSESYIREAVEGAFAQTYTPLQIVLSDDHSLDKTFQIMEQMAETYNGPHKILLNKNGRNLGIGAHVNRIMELARGEYIVVAAGDDISLPERTRRIYETFYASQGRAMAVFSDHEEIDTDGVSRGTVSTVPPEGFSDPLEMCRHLFTGVTGATNAWHRQVFDVFGPMAQDVTFEDRVIAFRASLLGDIYHIPEPLVHYRRHQENTVGMFHSPENEQMAHRLRCFLAVYENNKRDLQTFNKGCDGQNKVTIRCEKIINRRIRKFNSYLDILSGQLTKMTIGLLALILNGGSPLHGFKQYISVIAQR